MAELLLVRHGQASFGKANYDELSPLGAQQCRWLGEHLHDLALNVDRVVTGTLARHAQSAEALFDGLGDAPPLTRHAGFDEYDFIGLHHAYVAQNPKAAKKTSARSAAGEQQRDFYRVLKLALDAWVRGELVLASGQTWQQFSQNVADALVVTTQGDAARTLVITSGGVIATAVGLALALEPHRVFDLNLQVRNASVTQFFFNKKNLRFATFNNVAHLERADRVHAITYS